MVYHPGRNQVILNGGFSTQYTDELWKFDLTTNQWAPLWSRTKTRPSARGKACMFLVDDDMYLWGGIGNDGLDNDLWRFSFARQQWYQVTQPIDSPSPRHRMMCHYSTPRGVLYLYGGVGGAGPLGDFWQYDVKANVWTLLSDDGPVVSGGYLGVRGEEAFLFGGRYPTLNQTQLYACNLSSPSTSHHWSLIPLNPLSPYTLLTPRELFTAYYTPQDHKLRVFYGWDEEARCTSIDCLEVNLGDVITYPSLTQMSRVDVGVFHVHRSGVNETHCGKGVYEQRYSAMTGGPPVLTPAPLPRRGYAGVLIGANDTILFFGGSTLLEITNDLWSYNLTSGTFRDIAPAYLAPATRSYHAATVVQTDMYVFGGRGQGGALYNDLWRFDLEEETWHILRPSNALPPVRELHEMKAWGHFLVVVGGKTSNNERLVDVWAYSLLTNLWLPVLNADTSSASTSGSLEEAPRPPALLGACTALLNDHILVYGGQHEDLTLSHTLWIMNVFSQQWTQYDFDKAPYKGNPRVPIPLTFCQMICARAPNEDGLVYVIGGTDSLDAPRQEIYRMRINMTQGEGKFEISFEETLVPEPRQFLLFSTLTPIGTSRLLTTGGKYWDTTSSSMHALDLTALGHTQLYPPSTLPETTALGPGPLTGHTQVYSRGTLYVFGGSQVEGSTELLSVPNNRMWKYRLNNFPGNWTAYMRDGVNAVVAHENASLSADWACAPGSIRVIKTDLVSACPASPALRVPPTVCHACPAGTYSAPNGSVCLPCPAGHYNPREQASESLLCIPCPHGSYAATPGKAKCEPCLESEYCPTGSIRPSASAPPEASIQTKQPTPFQRPVAFVNRVLMFVYVGCGIGAPLLALLGLILPTRKYYPKVDIYSMKHPQHLNALRVGYYILSKTRVGGFFSLIFIGIATMFVSVQVINLLLDNTRETRALVPSVIRMAQDPSREEAPLEPFIPSAPFAGASRTSHKLRTPSPSFQRPSHPHSQTHPPTQTHTHSRTYIHIPPHARTPNHIPAQPAWLPSWHPFIRGPANSFASYASLIGPNENTNDLAANTTQREIAASFGMQLTLREYPGRCILDGHSLSHNESQLVKAPCVPAIFIALKQLGSAKTASWCAMIASSSSARGSCVVGFDCMDCYLPAAEASIAFHVDELDASSASNSIQFESHTGLQGQSSSVTITQHPTPGYIFRGTQASQFSFRVIPTVFTDERNSKDDRGFHLEGVDSVRGSMVTHNDYHYNKGVHVIAQLIKSDFTLEIKRYNHQAITSFLAALMGSIVGIMGGIGAGMKILEIFTRRFIHCVRRQRLKREGLPGPGNPPPKSTSPSTSPPSWDTMTREQMDRSSTDRIASAAAHPHGPATDWHHQTAEQMRTATHPQEAFAHGSKWHDAARERGGQEMDAMHMRVQANPMVAAPR